MARAAEPLDRVVELLEQILRVEAVQVAVGKSITEGARLLKLAGLDNQTIADVLNTTPATVRALTSGKSAERGGKKKRS